MNKLILVTAFAVLSSTSFADDGQPTIRFNGAVGSQPFASIGGAPQPNDINGVLPGGRPWPITSFKAKIRADGSIEAIGTGLILGGGAFAGTAGPVTQVGATLFCGASPAVAFNSPATALSTSGDFVLKAKLTPTPPTPCVNPVLLIRGVFGGVLGPWFAVGIPDAG